jgi:transcription elongation GreA/GreB family factor
MLGTGEVKEITINNVTFPLHNAFVGKHEGDRVNLSGKQYEIVSIL